MFAMTTAQLACSNLPGLQIYAAPLQGGSRAVVMFNRHQQLDPLFNVQNLTVFWASIGIAPNATVCSLASTTCQRHCRKITGNSDAMIWHLCQKG